MAVVHENMPQLTEKWNLPKTHANLAAGFGILESLLQLENSRAEKTRNKVWLTVMIRLPEKMSDTLLV